MMFGAVVVVFQALLTGMNAFLWISNGSPYSFAAMIFCGLMTIFTAMTVTSTWRRY